MVLTCTKDMWIPWALVSEGKTWHLARLASNYICKTIIDRYWQVLHKLCSPLLTSQANSHISSKWSSIEHGDRLLPPGPHATPAEILILAWEIELDHLNAWESCLQAVNPVGGCVAGSHLDVHIQGVEAWAWVALGPGGIYVRFLLNTIARTCRVACIAWSCHTKHGTSRHPESKDQVGEII